MWYTTDFEWHFNLSRCLTVKESNTLKAITEIRHEWPTDVGIWIWCKWIPTEDWEGIEWSGAEKFYDYDRWLQYIIDTYLLPRGINTTGEVKYSWEDIDDVGKLKVIDNKVTIVKFIPSWEKIECPHCWEEFYANWDEDIE